MNKHGNKHIVRAPLDKPNISQGSLSERLRFAHLVDGELVTITGGGTPGSPDFLESPRTVG